MLTVEEFAEAQMAGVWRAAASSLGRPLEDRLGAWGLGPDFSELLLVREQSSVSFHIPQRHRHVNHSNTSLDCQILLLPGSRSLEISFCTEPRHALWGFVSILSLMSSEYKEKTCVEHL